MTGEAMTATIIGSVDNPGIRGSQFLWKLDPPLAGTEYVITSAIDVAGVPETYIFASDETGQVIDLDELPGSVTGVGSSHARALRAAGYEPRNPEVEAEIAEAAAADAVELDARWAAAQVGDDRLEWHDSVECGAYGDTSPYRCTARVGHPGQHVALDYEDSGEVLAVWDRVDAATVQPEDAVRSLIDRVARLTASEATQLAAAVDQSPARRAGWSEAFAAAAAAAHAAGRLAGWNRAWGDASYVARSVGRRCFDRETDLVQAAVDAVADAAGALAAADLVGKHGYTQHHHDLLLGPWRELPGAPNAGGAR